MTSQEEKIQRFLMGKKSKSSEQVAKFQLPPILTKDWYLSSWFEKLIFVAGFFSLIWTILSFLIFGVPWK